MLVSKNNTYDSGDIVSFKLVNGDEIIAKVVGEDMISFTLPSVVNPVNISSGKDGIREMLKDHFMEITV